VSVLSCQKEATLAKELQEFTSAEYADQLEPVAQSLRDISQQALASWLAPLLSDN
jgi:hypothetical protein